MTKLKVLPNRYIHYIKKREAFKLEALEPEPEQTKRISPKYVRYYSYSITKGKRTCVICGQDGVYNAYFQVKGAQIIEKYCQVCCDKYVYLEVDQSVPTFSK